MMLNDVEEFIFILYMVSIHHALFLTISFTFYELKWSCQCHFPLSNITESYQTNVELYNKFLELITMCNEIPLGII